ncbi:helix-turn-helix domain-containing protein [Micromonospora wenchangensis]|uniref:helix-turn-helix domain-containing protein n=1 Tax=Micromonospora wenchangensis TaxID=1185415 RepID=UPI00118331FE|nr:helix-turn-helix transcriptional regulator [Micromonospora wenchangensis]
MSPQRTTNPVRQRRIELALTQQEAARRAEVSVATWRRLEAASGLDGFKADNVRGFARALRLGMAEFHRLMGSDEVDEVDQESGDLVRFFNASFTGDPITAADAMALHSTVAFSDFAPMNSKRFGVEHALGCGFPAFLKGEASIREVDLLRDLPELALTQVNNHWLVRMGERIMRVGGLLGEGRVPRAVCLADEYALSIVIMNTDPPSVGDVLHMYPGLHDREHLAPRYWEDEDGHELVVDWRDRMLGALLPPEEAHDYRRHDLLVLEMHGQGIYDVSDPRHPLRWFDRDDLQERCQSSLDYARLSDEEKEAREREALERIGW